MSVKGATAGRFHIVVVDLCLHIIHLCIIPQYGGVVGIISLSASPAENQKYNSYTQK